ncbi:tyrosinase family protein [Microbispora sp. NEAU-D428]|uniref:tyrosinase family protein n=1 Tax=Microbispora sitophila TaxID=2771537 RepID=UPI001866BF58|nr:tyrosinase family protein [Microbispora sitophila]MBE3009896.1 tyrosinase family protein [Microbispora sitophila]
MLASAVWGTAAIAFGVRGTAAHADPAPPPARRRAGDMTTRRRTGDMTTEQWQAFVGAVRALKARGTYDALVKTYADDFTATHANGFFLPWQRRYLLDFERALQRLDPAVSVPYWDWPLDGRAPERSTVLSKAYFGGNGSAKRDQAVLDGAFAGWTAKVPRVHPLRRSYADGGKIPPWASPDLIANMLKNPDFQVFNMQVEIHIGAVQMGIGGDLAQPVAPNDPLYWVVACFGDLLWHMWRSRHPKAPVRSAYGNVTEESRLPRYGDTVAGVLDIEKLGYRYDDVWPRSR